jgi:hypothetical protein
MGRQPLGLAWFRVDTSRPYRDGLVEAIDWFSQAGCMTRPRELRGR